MFKEEKDYYIIEEFKKYDIKAIFTKKSLGNMARYISEDALNNRLNVLKLLNEEDKKIVCAKQTHSDNIIFIDENFEDFENLENIDGFVSKRNDIAIFTFYADCLPIYIIDKKTKAFGIAHSGWKGSYQEIIKKLIDKMQECFSSNKDDLLVALGIGISLEDYEVSEDFYYNFCEKFKDLAQKSFKIENGKYFFDNTILNYNLAIKYGIKKENIIIENKGVRAANTFSHRLDEIKGRSAAVIMHGK